MWAAQRPSPALTPAAGSNPSSVFIINGKRDAVPGPNWLTQHGWKERLNWERIGNVVGVLSRRGPVEHRDKAGQG